jgi:hypothetical protein
MGEVPCAVGSKTRNVHTQVPHAQAEHHARTPNPCEATVRNDHVGKPVPDMQELR